MSEEMEKDELRAAIGDRRFQNAEKISDALSGIGDDLIRDASDNIPILVSKKKHTAAYILSAAAAVVVLIGVSLFVYIGSNDFIKSGLPEEIISWQDEDSAEGKTDEFSLSEEYNQKLPAEEDEKTEGTVEDCVYITLMSSSEIPISGALIMLFNENGDLIASGVSDGNGLATLKKPGKAMTEAGKIQVFVPCGNEEGQLEITTSGKKLGEDIEEGPAQTEGPYEFAYSGESEIHIVCGGNGTGNRTETETGRY